MKGTTGKALKLKIACKFVRLVLMVEGKAGGEKMPESITNQTGKSLLSPLRIGLYAKDLKKLLKNIKRGDDMIISALEK